MIHCGDAVRVLGTIPQNSIDLTIFSPPYDSIRDYGNNWTLDRIALGKEIFRVSKDGAMCCVVIQDGTKDFAKSLSTFRWGVEWIDSVGWKLFECCIYQRHGRPGAWWNQRFRVDHEYILMFFKGDRPKCFDKNSLMVDSKHAGKIFHGTSRQTDGSTRKILPTAVNVKKCRGTVWQYATSNTEGNKVKMQHPATFPDKLADDLIQCFSVAGDTVLDPMCGSGTTCISAAKLSRKYVGIEINQTYVNIANQRLQQEISNDKCDTAQI